MHKMYINHQILHILIGYHVRTKTSTIEIEEKNWHGIADQSVAAAPTLVKSNFYDIVTSCVIVWLTCACCNNLPEICTYIMLYGSYSLLFGGLRFA